MSWQAVENQRRGGGQRDAFALVAGDQEQVGPQGGDVAGGVDQGVDVVADLFGDAEDGGRDDRELGRHGFEDDAGIALDP